MTIRVALAQVQSDREPARNLEKAGDLIRSASEAGSALLVFPEYVMSWGEGRHGREEMLAVAQPLHGMFVTQLCGWARSHSIWLIAGMIEAPEQGDRAYNTTVVINQNGELAMAYRKTHLFDALGQSESSSFLRGDGLVQPLETPLGKLGVFVCYELRFPEVARSLALRGAEILVVPSAWYAGPSKDMQWETLIRSRAIENGCYVLAAAQTGHEFAGHSMVVDPRGVAVASAGTEEALIWSEIDLDRVRAVRGSMPSLAQRRPELYR